MRTLTFIVRFELGDSTRMVRDDQEVTRVIEALAGAAAELWSAGPIPAVTVWRVPDNHLVFTLKGEHVAPALLDGRRVEP